MQPIVALLVLASTAAAPAPTDAHRYEVRIEDASGKRASVTASIDVGGVYLNVRNGGNDLPNGFATFVNLMTVRDQNGDIVTFARDSVSRWKLSRSVQRARIEYEVDFSYAREPWPSGNEQAGQWENGALYTVTKPLFVTGSVDAPVRVTFVLPSGWRIATPWRSVAGSQNEFDVDGESSLTDNSIVLGRFAATKVSAGPFTFTLATFGRTLGSAQLMARALGAVAKEYVRIFPTTPPTSYMMTVFTGTEDDGESFAQSFAFRTATMPTSANGIIWATTLAHELFHFWNGNLLHGADDVASAWFSEGATEYYANRTLLRTGTLTPCAFLSKAGNMAGLYVYFRTQPMFDSISVAYAGSRRTRYRFGIYNGGWAMAFALDRDIANLTGGRARLDDVMRELLRRHGNTSTPYSIGEVFEVASSIAGKPMQPFLSKYVEGKDLMPIKELFGELGIDADFISYTGEGYLRFAANPTLAQRKAWEGYSGLTGRPSGW